MEGCSKFGSKFKGCIVIPQRHLMAIMLSFATFNSYTMRITISLAITEMTKKPNAPPNNTHLYCPVESETYYNSTKSVTEKYDWSEKDQGLVLSSFYWPYIITQLPGALIAEKFGGKHVLGIGMLLCAIFTIATPSLVEASHGSLGVLIALRVGMGFVQGPVYPVITTMVSQWVPPKDKSLASCLAFSGALLGTALTNLIGGRIISAAQHWNAIFYLYGGLGLLWNLAWQLFCYSFPSTNPCIKEKEKAYLDEALKKDISAVRLKTPIKSIFTSFYVWTFIIAHFGHDWGWYIMVTDLPKYLSNVLKFDVEGSGLYSSLPYFAMWVSGIFLGYAADFLIKKKIMSTKTVRQVFGTLGQAVPGVFIVLASYSGCDTTAAIIFFVLSQLFMGFSYSGIKVNAIDLSPNFSGTVMAAANGLGVFSGMLAPYLAGVIVKENSLTEWRIVFWIAFAWLAGTNVVYVLFLSADVQKWNNSQEEEES